MSNQLTDAEIASLIDQGYVQTSRKYRHVSRLPSGMTGLETLAHHAPEIYEDIMRRAELEARDIALRSLVPAVCGSQEVLSRPDLERFRSMGGRVSG
jgi:hypothetical protein